mgnify:CR=1 FL=1
MGTEGMDIKLMPPSIDRSDEWTEAILSCVGAIKTALPQGAIPTKETAETVRLLAEAAARLTFG